MERTILHSDLNSFYASVEIMLDPSLRGKAVAVCGLTEDRHGIVLAKSELAKKAGIKTGMVNWEARQRCPDLIILSPQYEQYMKYSRAVREIYQRYTDRVEPFGMDECWIDVTSGKSCGGGLKIAEEIRNAVRSELGLTVSIGVSFNKMFAKLGSDMKKPDAVTLISKDEFRKKIWPLPAYRMIYVGRATSKKLAVYGIHTIGDIAGTPPEFLKRVFGVNGVALWRNASGYDQSKVMHMDYSVPVKSIGHGITCVTDLNNTEEVWKVILELSQDIGHKLRIYGLSACGVQLTVKDNTLAYKQYQAPLTVATRSPMEISRKARELFLKKYTWRLPVRAVTVRAINLISSASPEQLSIFDDIVRRERLDKLETAVEEIRNRFGKRAIYSACLMGDLKIPGHGLSEIIMPGIMHE